MASDALNDEADPPPQKGSSSVRLGTPVRHGAVQSEGVGTSSLPALVDIAAVSQALGISTRQVRRFVAEDQIPFVASGISFASILARSTNGSMLAAPVRSMIAGATHDKRQSRATEGRRSEPLTAAS